MLCPKVKGPTNGTSSRRGPSRNRCDEDVLLGVRDRWSVRGLRVLQAHCRDPDRTGFGVRCVPNAASSRDLALPLWEHFAADCSSRKWPLQRSRASRVVATVERASSEPFSLLFHELRFCCRRRPPLLFHLPADWAHLPVLWARSCRLWRRRHLELDVVHGTRHRPRELVTQFLV